MYNIHLVGEVLAALPHKKQVFEIDIRPATTTGLETSHFIFGTRTIGWNEASWISNLRHAWPLSGLAPIAMALAG